MKLLGKSLDPGSQSTSPSMAQLHQLETGYPRPQLQRSQWINLNGTWKFCFDDEGKYKQSANIQTWTHQIEVPFAPECERSGIHDTQFHPNCWYEREFEVPLDRQRVLLHFGAVDYHALVWVNHQFVGEHEGGHTPFSFDITEVLNPNETQQVTVWAQDDPHDLAKPRGKQAWLPDAHSIWYPRTSGIWQTVWVECVPETYLEKIRWTADFERWEIGFEAIFGGAKCDDLQIKVRLTARDHLLVNDTYEVINGDINRRIALSDPGIDDYSRSNQVSRCVRARSSGSAAAMGRSHSNFGGLSSDSVRSSV